MRYVIATALRACLTPPLVWLPACSTMPPAQQARITQTLAVACTVDGAVVPLAQPVVATLGSGGATAASMDALLVHPAVVAACQAVNGTPASAASIGGPATPAGSTEAKPTN